MAADNYFKVHVRLDDGDTENAAALDKLAPGDVIKNGLEYNWVFPFDDSSRSDARKSMSSVQRKLTDIGFDGRVSSYRDVGIDMIGF